ncbi:MAG TPA: histidinol phosphate phosphatase domain-containing protein [Syntrophales bacterium]|nr:histidinol phosphate phosphatase domain-containing protein [Syntrophales bacterium]
MIDLHTHSILSDGELIPSELARRAKVAGYRVIAITDHGDQSNLDFIIPRLVKVCQKLQEAGSIQAIPGIELTHVPPEYIYDLAVEARQHGAKIVVVHGETIVEPVIARTNMAALNSPIDILAHPGLITEEEAVMAAKNSIYLEITTRKGHSLTNGHVLKMARRSKASLILNTDSHAPHDLVNKEMARKIALGTGMTEEEMEIMFRNSEALFKKASGVK